MDPLTNPAFIAFAAMAPVLIAFVKQAGLSKQANALIALACYIIIGTLGAVLSGDPLTLENAVALITTATVVGSAAYGLIWTNIGVHADGTGSLDDRLTEATSFIR